MIEPQECSGCHRRTLSPWDERIIERRCVICGFSELNPARMVAIVLLTGLMSFTTRGWKYDRVEAAPPSKPKRKFPNAGQMRGAAKAVERKAVKEFWQKARYVRRAESSVCSVFFRASQGIRRRLNPVGICSSRDGTSGVCFRGGCLRIEVRGIPGPQGSKKFVGFSGKGKALLIESSKLVKPWRTIVTYESAIEARGKEQVSFAGPVDVEMHFTMPKPKSCPKSRRFPDRKPDLSKLIRSTEDALTESGIWEDDARVVRMAATKCWPNEGAYALSSPGVLIIIENRCG